ncbi:hypothetical protein QBC32DRAFT_28138 [Pseudoneurospora amorphoporcata]|uniref:Uncharacterized protein n=1 Tax=Pseudoneurospora amorphoporcata TaxID=241081 RepID=A0AAN6SJG9_9PEZI|nr:hypothetical protein QBC32DRAFT_28138 [Pseudoneurospora amorphoporcata]
MAPFLPLELPIFFSSFFFTGTAAVIQKRCQRDRKSALPQVLTLAPSSPLGRHKVCVSVRTCGGIDANKGEEEGARDAGVEPGKIPTGHSRPK